MKALTKRITLWLCALGLCASAVAALSVTAETPVYAAADIGVVADFTAQDVTLFDEVGGTLCEFKENVDPDGDGVADAATALKFKCPSNKAWNYVKIQFNNQLTVKDVYTLKVRFYINIGLGASTKPLIMWKSFADVDTKYVDNLGQKVWHELEFTREETMKLADPADGKIKGLVIGMHPVNDSVNTPEFYLDSVTYDLNDVPVILDNDKETTGEDVSYMLVKRGESVPVPETQVFGKQVTWYADENRTQPFDFENTKAAVGVTLYGKYEDFVPTKGVVSECTEADTRYKAIPLDDYYKEYKDGEPVGGTNGVLNESCVSYVKNVDTDGDGVIDAETAIKISNWSTWHGFALEFAAPVDMEKVSKITFRVFFDLKGVAGGSIWAGPGDFGNGIKWLDLVQEKWWNVSFSSADELAEFKNSDGKFDYFGWVIGFTLGAGETVSPEAYMLIDKITYEWNCNVTFDCDTANSGVPNYSKVYSSGKKIGTSPKATLKEGFDVEWYTDSARTVAFDIKNQAVSDDMTLYAKYLAKKLNVTFDYNESESGIANETVAVDYNGKATAPETTRKGYTIEWYTDEALSEKFDFNTAITEDITLYAKYVEKKGCGSAIGADFAAVAVTLAVAAATVAAVRKNRKKEN